MATKESSVPKPLFSFIVEYSSDNFSDSSSDEMQSVTMSPKDFQSLVGGTLRKARPPHD